MSSRALKKAQKARDRAEFEERSPSEGEASDPQPPAGGHQSAFALLGEDEEAEAGVAETFATDDGISHDENDPHTQVTPRSTPKRKKKKKKGKSPASSTPRGKGKTSEPGSDDIDKALKELSLHNTGRHAPGAPRTVNPGMEELFKLLSIDLQHLKVSNEMRRLFGKAALEVDRENEAQGPSAQATPHGTQITIAEAVAGRNAQGGAGLPAMIRRRNIFVQGKESWPKATGGGLKMEVLEEREGGVKVFTYVHNQEYRSSQREFDAVAKSMDPNLMVNLLVYIPYHISTLLQVSEIVQHDRDHATCGDLLERALFSFGRAVHPSFPASLEHGKARLDFSRPENREFWLAAWRYVWNISMRATWRTAYEWAKLLLSLDPENDPYRISMVIDQFALRSRQYRQFLELSQNEYLKQSIELSNLPNMAFSRSLALEAIERDSPEHSNAKLLISRAIEDFPWVAARLYQELSMERMPPSIWGKEPPSDVEKLRCEYYVTQALDLWKTSEAKDFLRQGAKDVHIEIDAMLPDNHDQSPISIDESRHIILLDKPALISLLDPHVVSLVSSSADPLPPQNNHVSYTTGVGPGVRSRQPNNVPMDPEAVDSLINSDPAQFMRQLRDMQDAFEAILTVRAGTTGPSPEPSPDGRSATSATEAVVEAEAVRHPMAPRLRWLSTRITLYHNALRSRPELRTNDGSVATVDANGLVAINLVEADDYPEEWRTPRIPRGSADIESSGDEQYEP
ncbi:MAG: hypothetical protein M1831_003312 [Alyxoria varia]|nr:MAG: hypothetical protein M1831_003312 [Alyxoria varia]